MSQTSELFRAATGPREGRIAVIDVDNTGDSTDLSDSGELGEYASSGHYVDLICDQNLWYKWAPASGGSVSSSATTGVTRAFFLPANTRVSELPPTGCVHLVWVAADTGTLRVSVSSEYRQ